MAGESIDRLSAAMTDQADWLSESFENSFDTFARIRGDTIHTVLSMPISYPKLRHAEFPGKKSPFKAQVPTGSGACRSQASRNATAIEVHRGRWNPTALKITGDGARHHTASQGSDRARSRSGEFPGPLKLPPGPELQAILVVRTASLPPARAKTNARRGGSQASISTVLVGLWNQRGEGLLSKQKPKGNVAPGLPGSQSRFLCDQSPKE